MPELPLEISCRTVKSHLDAGDDILLVDCREQQEHELVQIAGSLLVPMSEIQNRLDELRPHADRHVVVLCHLGGRSAQVTTWLREQGFTNVQSLAGGIEQWAVEIDPSLRRY